MDALSRHGYLTNLKFADWVIENQGRKHFHLQAERGEICSIGERAPGKGQINTVPGVANICGRVGQAVAVRIVVFLQVDYKCRELEAALSAVNRMLSNCQKSRKEP